MLVDFIKLKELIPQKGTVSFMFRLNTDGQIGVCYKVTPQKAPSVSSTSDKSLEGTKKAIEEAEHALEKALSFVGTAEDLNSQFEEKIRMQHSTVMALADAVNQSTVFLNERIKALKDKKDTKKPDAKPEVKKGEKKTEGDKAKEPLIGGLFGEVSADPGSGSLVSPAAGTDEAGSEEEDALEEIESGQEVD